MPPRAPSSPVLVGCLVGPSPDHPFRERGGRPGSGALPRIHGPLALPWLRLAADLFNGLFEVGAFREALEAGVRAANVKGSLRHAPPRAKQGGAQVKNEAFWSKAVGLFEKESYDTVLRGGARGPSGEGALISVYDIRSARNLLEEGAAAAVRVPKSSRREQNPLQLTNGGTGRLQVFAQCQGAGVDVSPGHVVIPPGTMASIIVRVDPVSDPSARLLLWRSEHGTNEAFEIIIHRS